MANLEIELGNELIQGIKCLAVRHYGDSGEASVGRVVESALMMRLLATELVEGGGNETEEPIVNLEFTEGESKMKQAADIRRWLFRR